MFTSKKARELLQEEEYGYEALVFALEKNLIAINDAPMEPMPDSALEPAKYQEWKSRDSARTRLRNGTIVRLESARIDYARAQRLTEEAAGA